MIHVSAKSQVGCRKGFGTQHPLTTLRHRHPKHTLKWQLTLQIVKSLSLEARHVNTSSSRRIVGTGRVGGAELHPRFIGYRDGRLPKAALWAGAQFNPCTKQLLIA